MNCFFFELDESKNKMENNFMIEKKFAAISRTYKDGRQECLINFHNDFHKATLSKIRSKFHYDQVFIYINDAFHQELSNEHNSKSLSEKDSLPYFEFTKNPVNVSMESEQVWSEIRDKVFIPNGNKNDWDFFEMEWILQKWNSGLGFFDYDCLYIIPSYPKDLMNNLIHPDIVIYYLQRFVRKNNIQLLKNKFYALYLFYKDKLGKKMLHFFYEETLAEGKTDRQTLIKKLHTMYHSTKETHPFRRFIFYNSNCLPSMTKKNFQVKKYILVYLSFHSIFFCNHYVNSRKNYIHMGIGNSPFLSQLRQYFHSVNDIPQEVQKIHNHHQQNFTWMSKEHFKNVNTPLAKYLYHNWETSLRRNINLWDLHVLTYPDSQCMSGGPLTELFPMTWVGNFHKKDFDFPEDKRSKRKLKL